MKSAYENSNKKIEEWKAKCKMYKFYFDLHCSRDFSRYRRKYSEESENKLLAEAMNIISFGDEKYEEFPSGSKEESPFSPKFVESLVSDVDKLKWENAVQAFKYKRAWKMRQSSQASFSRSPMSSARKSQDYSSMALNTQFGNNKKARERSKSVNYVGIDFDDNNEVVNEEEIEEKKRKQPDFFRELDVSAIREANKTSQSILYNETSYLFRKK